MIYYFIHDNSLGVLNLYRCLFTIVIFVLSLLILCASCYGALDIDTRGSSVDTATNLSEPSFAETSKISPISVVQPKSQETKDSQSLEKPVSGYTPTLRVSSTLNSEAVVIAEYKGWNGNWPCVYISTDEPVFDMLISVAYDKNSFLDESVFRYYVQLIREGET